MVERKRGTRGGRDWTPQTLGPSEWIGLGEIGERVVVGGLGWGGGGGGEGKAEVVWNKGKTKGGRGRWGLAAVGGGGVVKKLVWWRAVSPDFWRLETF